MDTQKCLHGDSPMNLSLTHIACFYFTCYYGCPAASAVGATDEDKGCSLSDSWATLGSVGGGMTFASDLGSTPSIG